MQNYSVLSGGRKNGKKRKKVSGDSAVVNNRNVCMYLYMKLCMSIGNGVKIGGDVVIDIRG